MPETTRFLRARLDGAADTRADDLDAIERADEFGGALDAPDVLAAAFDDPDALTEREYEALDEVVAQAEAIDLEAEVRRVLGGRRADPLIPDVVETWLAIAQRHPRVPDSKIEEWFRESRGDDPEKAARAEDLIVRHNVKLIWDAAIKAGGKAVAGRASDMRDDILGQANIGATEALRRYNPAKLPAARAFSAKSILGYMYVRIKKHVKLWLAKERSNGLSQEQFRDLGRITAALHALKDDLQGERGDGRAAAGSASDLVERVRAYLEQQARAAYAAANAAAGAAGQAVPVPSPEDLRRFGGLTRNRIEALIHHQTSKLSLNQGGADDDDERDLEESVGVVDARLDAGLVDEDGLAAMAEAIFGTAPLEIERKQLFLFAAAQQQLGASGRARYPDLFPQELGAMAGRTPDSVIKYGAQTGRGIAGDDGVEVDWVRRPRVPLTPGEAAERLSAGTFDETMLTKLRRAISLREVLEAAGVTFADPDTDVADLCPFEPAAPAGSFAVEDDERFCCSSCRRSGDVIDWLMLRSPSALTRDEATLQAVRLANHLPPELLFKENMKEQVLVTRHQKKKAIGRRHA